MAEKLGEHSPQKQAHALVLWHYWRSSCSWRVRWALAIKGLTYEAHAVDLLAGAQSTDNYKTMNPTGLVPALAIDGTAFGESLALLEWLEESYPEPPLLPREPAKRLRVRQLCQIIASGTQPLQNLATQRAHSSDKEAQAEFARLWIRKGLNSYEAILRQGGTAGTFSVGNNVSMADLCLVPQIYNARRYNVETKEWPTLSRIGETCLTLAECLASAPDAFQPEMQSESR